MLTIATLTFLSALACDPGTQPLPTPELAREPGLVEAEAAEPTDAPPTVAPTTVAPTTVAPPTVAPTTVAPPTDAPPTDAPPTDAPPTDAPPTDAPPTVAQPTDAPPTVAQPNDAPPTDAPPTVAPPTDAAATVPAAPPPGTAVPPTLSPWIPRLLAEVHAGSAVAFGGLQGLVAGGGARLLVGPRNLDVALGIAVDFDGQSAFVGAGNWSMASTRMRLETHVGLGELSLFDARLGVTLGSGARFAQHTASFTGVRRTVVVTGVTTRAALEAFMPAGPGRFGVTLPLDVTFDLAAPVRDFTPVAVGVLLGYRLEL